MSNTGLEPYVPRVASGWDAVAGGSLWQPVDGSLVFVDISGFTNLSERLAQKGRIGAEELTSVLNRVFGRMLEIVYDRGGSLLKFGGDALLLLFSADDHVIQASAATVEMRAALRAASQERTSVGRIDLKMSSGIHTGSVDFFLVGDSHRELIVTGPAASVTTMMEGTADAGEIAVSEEVRQLLPAGFTGERKGEGWLLRKRKINHPACGLIARAASDEAHLSQFVPRGLRDHLQAGIEDSEHRIATIAFVKYKGVDSLMADHGPERVGRELDHLARVVEGAADEEGITFLASDIDADGGKMILAAGVPASQHDDEGRVLRAARRILDSELGLSVRIGINRGHVFSGNVGTGFRRTYTVMGDTVNLAARLMAAAESGGLYASPSVLNLSSTLFRTEPLEAFYVKGKEQPVQAFAVFEETGVRPPETTADLPFHGRDAELEMLVGIVNTCSRVGRGGIMTISGDTGVGKSRLIAEVLERCSGMDTMAIQAEPSGVDNPYWAFRDPLRRFLGIERGSQEQMTAQLTAAVEATSTDLAWALPLIGDVIHIDVEDNERTAQIDTQFRPERTADVLIELLSAGHTRPVAVVAEDGQWLDEASTRLLARVGAAAEERPWTVLVTARRTETDFEPMGEEIVLRPLEDDAVRDIAVEVTQATPLRPHELEAIVSKADGNPLFLGEILRVVSETGSAERLPDSLDAVISREIDTLPPLPRQLLRYSSVLGRRFRRPVLNEFLAPEQVRFDEATVRELERFIEDEGEDRLAFRHSVVHDIAYESLSYAKRRELHARAGDVIERQAGDDPGAVAEYLSTHYSQSGEYQKAWKYASVAADRAKRTYANAEAAAHYERAIAALRHIPEKHPKKARELWLALSGVRELAGEMEAARAALSNALSASASDPVSRADVFLKRAGTWMNSGDLALAKRNVTIGRKGLNPEQSIEHVRMLARLDAFEASINASKGDPVEAAKYARSARDRAEDSNEKEALARALSVLDFSNFMMGSDEPKYGPQAIEIYQELGSLERSVNVINNMGVMSYLEGDWDGAVAWYQRAVETAEASGNVLDAALARANIAEVLVGQRKYDEAKGFLEEAHRVYQASNANPYLPLVHLLRAQTQQGLGDIEGAIAALEDLVASQLEGQATNWTQETVVALGDAYLAIGRPDAALATLEEQLAKTDEARPADAERIRGSALVMSGDIEAGRQALDASLESALADGNPHQELLALEAIVEAQRRDGENADSTLETRIHALQSKLGVVGRSSSRLAPI